MGRLTKRLGDQVILKEVGITDCGKICDRRKDFDNPCDECPIDDAFRKLAHYEDLEEQGRLIELPCEWGQFVKVKEDNSIGTVSAYTVHSDGIFVWVSGYKESWCGEYLLENIQILTKEEAEAKLRDLLEIENVKVFKEKFKELKELEG